MAGRWKFRKELLLIPLTCLLAMWFAAGIEPGFGWGQVMNWLHVHDRDRYTRLFVLGLWLVAIIGVWRVLRSGQDEDS